MVLRGERKVPTECLNLIVFDVCATLIFEPSHEAEVNEVHALPTDHYVIRLQVIEDPPCRVQLLESEQHFSSHGEETKILRLMCHDLFERLLVEWHHEIGQDHRGFALPVVPELENAMVDQSGCVFGASLRQNLESFGLESNLSYVLRKFHRILSTILRVDAAVHLCSGSAADHILQSIPIFEEYLIQGLVALELAVHHLYIG